MATLIFDVHGSIHFQEVRAALIRIPEVIQKIRLVQDILDKKGIALDLSNFIASEDSTFLHHYRRKEFAAIIVQLGLYDRYLRYFQTPSHCVGVVNSISALRVVTGQLTLEQLVDEAFKKLKSSSDVQELPGLPILTGIQIPRYQRFMMNEKNGFESNEAPQADLEEMVTGSSLNPTYEVGLGSDRRKGTIELDPHLRWVWDQVKASKELLAAN